MHVRRICCSALSFPFLLTCVSVCVCVWSTVSVCRNGFWNGMKTSPHCIFSFIPYYVFWFWLAGSKSKNQEATNGLFALFLGCFFLSFCFAHFTSFLFIFNFLHSFSPATCLCYVLFFCCLLVIWVCYCKKNWNYFSTKFVLHFHCIFVWDFFFYFCFKLSVLIVKKFSHLLFFFV